MSQTNRNTLKQFFLQGKMPQQEHFQTLIDSMINITDDGIEKTEKDGLRLAPTKQQAPMISLFNHINDTEALWKITLGTDGQLSVQSGNNSKPLLSLHPDGTVRMDYQEMDIRIKGSLTVSRIEGEIQGECLADGKWHTLDIPSEGCRAYHIMAGCGKLKHGQYALVEATAMHCYGKKRKIRTSQSWFGSIFNKIRLRWHGRGQQCQLQIRSRRNYGDDIFIHFHIIDLWGDPTMSLSDRRKSHSAK